MHGNEWCPKFGERVLVSDNGRDYKEVIFMAKLPEIAEYPFLTTRVENEFGVHNVRPVNYSDWKYCKPIEKKIIKLTKKQIAEKFEVDEVIIEDPVL